MKLKLACADFTFPLLEHEHSLDLIAMLGVQGVDIGLFEGRSHLWPSRELVYPEATGRRLGQKLSDRQLACADVFLQLDSDFTKLAVNHPDAARRAKARDDYLRLLDYASAAGSHHVTLLAGVDYSPAEPREQSWARCCEELAWRVDQAKSRQLTFSVEGHVGSITRTPEELRQLVVDTPGLTLTLDYTHFTRDGLADARVEPLLELASHFHVRGARQGRLQTSFAQNTIDYARVLEVMSATNYAGYVGLEYVWIEWEGCNEVDNLCETILFRDFLLNVAAKK